MPQLSEILKDIRPEVDFSRTQDFVHDGTLDSFDIASLVSALDKTYGIQISGLDIVPDNFRNIASIEQLLAKYGRP